MVPWEHNQQTEPIRTWKTIVKAENNSSANIASLLKFLLIRSFQIDFVECFTETTFKNKNTHHFHILFISYINDSENFERFYKTIPKDGTKGGYSLFQTLFAKHHMDIKTF